MRLGIIGAGQAACTLICELLTHNYDGTIWVFNEEAIAPYERPPLSKSALSGNTPIKPSPLLAPTLLEHQSITWVQERATEIIPDKGVVKTPLSQFVVDHIVLATGCRPRLQIIPNLPIRIRHTIRTLADSVRLKSSIPHAKNITILGAGFLAFEAAAALECDADHIRILSRGPRALEQVSQQTSDYLVNQSSAKVKTNIEVIGFSEGQLGTTKGPIPTDLLIQAIGAVPNTELAIPHKLASKDGIPTNGQMQTAHPNVSAIGDVAIHPNPILKNSHRIESVAEANDSARVLANRLLGQYTAFNSVPWFWSDQGQEKLQIAGFSERTDESNLLVAEDNKLVVLRHRGDHVTAVEAINTAKEFMAAKHLMQSGTISLSACRDAGSLFTLFQSSRL